MTAIITGLLCFRVVEIKYLPCRSSLRYDREVNVFDFQGRSKLHKPSDEYVCLTIHEKAKSCSYRIVQSVGVLLYLRLPLPITLFITH